MVVNESDSQNQDKGNVNNIGAVSLGGVAGVPSAPQQGAEGSAPEGSLALVSARDNPLGDARGRLMEGVSSALDSGSSDRLARGLGSSQLKEAVIRVQTTDVGAARLPPDRLANATGAALAAATDGNSTMLAPEGGAVPLTKPIDAGDLMGPPAPEKIAPHSQEMSPTASVGGGLLPIEQSRGLAVMIQSGWVKLVDRFSELFKR